VTSNGGGGGVRWLLRTNLLGGGMSLGEKISEVSENAAYEAVCSATMIFLPTHYDGSRFIISFATATKATGLPQQRLHIGI